MALKTWKAQIGNREFQFKLKKDDASRSANQIRNAVNLQQFTREISTSFDGKESVFTTMALFGPGQAPIKDHAGYEADLAAALDKWAPILITEANRDVCMADFKAVYEKHIPILDKRQTPAPKTNKADAIWNDARDAAEHAVAIAHTQAAA